MKLRLIFALGIVASLFSSARADDTWANWERRWDAAFDNVPHETLPGRTLGIVVPSLDRDDALPMTAFGYESISRQHFRTVVFLMTAPADTAVEGLLVPGGDDITTPFGIFNVDVDLRASLLSLRLPVTADPQLFQSEAPRILQIQLSALKYILKGNTLSVRVLPVLVKFADPSASAKDYAPQIVDALQQAGVADDALIVIVANTTTATSTLALDTEDGSLLRAIRSLDVDAVLEHDAKIGEISAADGPALGLGTVLLKWFGADHAEILAYGHTGQLLLTKDRNNPTSFIAAGFASLPPVSPGILHVSQEKTADRFGPALRADILALVRQTLLSALNATAAAPPSLVDLEAAKKWPVYVTIFDGDGKIAGKSGSHLAGSPLEESLRRYTLEAVRQAEPALTKANANAYVIEVAIPYGFVRVSHPSELVPLLNGVVVSQKGKSVGSSPHGWRRYSDANQLLAMLSNALGLPPWYYALRSSEVESFRTLSFNEKEPFQDLNLNKHKKKSDEDGGGDTGTDGGGTGGGGGGAFPF